MARYAKNLIRSEVNTPKQREVIMTRIGDVKGSSDLDVIYLVGNERGTGKNKVYYNMQIIISDGENGKTVTIDLSGIEGYNDLDVIYLVGNERGTGKNKVYYNMQIIISDGENGKTVTIDLSGIEGYNPRIEFYLVGNERGTGKNKVYYNMQIIISDGENGKTVTIDLSGIEGYNPRIELENFKKVTSDNEILFSVEDIGNNGYLTAHMYYLDGDKAIKIFDTDYYNQLDSYQVIYQDKYKVDVIDINRGMTYSIDISGKDKDYLNSLYNNNGILKKRIAGKVLSVSGLSPINLIRSDILDLLVTQKIIGINEKDILGVMSNILSFEGKFLIQIIIINSIPIKLYIKISIKWM